MKLIFRTILLCFLTVFVSEIESSDLSKEIEGKKNDSNIYIFNKNEIFNQLFTINFYDNREKHNVRKNLTLVNNTIDTSYSFDSPLRNIHISNNLIADYLRNIGKLRNNRNITGISNGHFYLTKLIPVDSTNFIGVYVEYFGFERICYVFGSIKLVDNNYHLGSLYKKIETAGIGSISFERAFNLGGNNYYIISHNSGEGYEGIAINYFPNNFKNSKHILESCVHGDFDSRYDENIEYQYNYDKEYIVIKKYVWEGEPEPSFSKKESEWVLVNTNELQLRCFVNKLEKENIRYYPSKNNPQN